MKDKKEFLTKDDFTKEELEFYKKLGERDRSIMIGQATNIETAYGRDFVDTYKSLIRRKFLDKKLHKSLFNNKKKKTKTKTDNIKDVDLKEKKGKTVELDL